MSYASLAVNLHARPEPARIAALSAAIALNLAVILVATRPITSLYFSPVTHSLAPVALVRLITPPPVPVPPPPIELKPLPQPLTAQQVLPRPTPISTPVIISNPLGTIATPPITDSVILPAGTADAPMATAPVEASLAYRAHPVAYPAAALRQHLQGTVVLRVLVDETGKPLEVRVAQGSGHSLLDSSAREQVLTSWRFQPAIVNGHAVRAWASVPVTFALRG